MHSITICGSSLHVRIHLKAKNFWAKRERETENTSEQESKRRNNKKSPKRKKERNEKPAAHNNDERSQAAKLVSKITVCVYLCVCVRVCA